MDVDKILMDTELTCHGDEIKAWYDGYHFGEHDVYCPWDVMNHVKNLLLNPDTPQPAIGNTLATMILFISLSVPRKRISMRNLKHFLMEAQSLNRLSPTLPMTSFIHQKETFGLYCTLPVI